MDTVKKRPNRIANKVGLVFGLLEVLGPYRRRGRKTFWRCSCQCGNTSWVVAGNLSSGNTTSCGCLSSRNTIGTRKPQLRHGMEKTILYSKWHGMFARIYTNKGGIYTNLKVCRRWKRFENFLADMGKSYEEHLAKHGQKNTTLDRIDGWKGYSKKNCRWATILQQRHNRRR